MGAPRYKAYITANQLEAGNSSRVYATSRVKVCRFSFPGEFSPVGMSADDHDVVICVPTVVILLNLVASRPAFGRTCRIFDPQDVQKAPDVSNHEKGKTP